MRKIGCGRAVRGAAIAGLVQEVTDDKSLPKEERKQRQIEQAPHLSPKARLIKLSRNPARIAQTKLRRTKQARSGKRA